jgi:hypothetical protein
MSKLTVLKAEAEAMELAAEILAKSMFAPGGVSPSVLQLGRALEILLRNEAARSRRKLRDGAAHESIFREAGAVSS